LDLSLIPFPKYIKPLLARDRRSIKMCLSIALGSLIAGAIISILDPGAVITVISFFSEISEVNSYPIFQAFPVSGENFIDRLVFLWKTNILYEALIFLTLPGILRLSKIILVAKYMFIGVLMPTIILNFIGLTPVIALVIALEIIAFSLAAVAGDHLGIALLTPHKLYGNEGRYNAFKHAIREMAKYYTLIIAILVVSSIIECTLAFALSSIFS